MRVAVGVLLTALASAALGDERLFRAGIDTDRSAWGLREGVRFAVWPSGIGDRPGQGGPRGLIRVGYPILDDGGYSLVNFIAIEPIVEGQAHRGFSELEPSDSDGRRGKLIEAGPPPGVEWQPGEEGTPYPGHVARLEGDHVRLSVCLRVEGFRSGAHVYLLASVRTDRPGELKLQAFTEEASAPLAACILTATMGNFARLRELHLRDRVVTSHELYPGFEGNGFAPHRAFGLDELARTADGSVIAAATTDEEDPASVMPDERRPWFWRYPGKKLTQYWRKYAGTFDESLRATVNARRAYWASEWPIPGGISFENFELNEGFTDGQTTCFGLTERGPEELLAAEDD